MTRNNFQWRPNDYSSQTKLKYRLEAGHWLSAVKSTSASTTGGLTELFGIIGIFLGIFMSAIFVVFYGLLELYKYFFPPKAPYDPKETGEPYHWPEGLLESEGKKLVEISRRKRKEYEEDLQRRLEE